MTLQAAESRLVLASASPTRLALLHAAGLAVEARPAAIDEAAVRQAAAAEGRSAGETALLLAEMKAARVSARDPAALVIGADQMLVCDGVWFDKPADRAGAVAQLAALCGRAHTLPTAVVCLRGGLRLWHHLAEPMLVMRPFSRRFLDIYLEAEGEAVTSSVGCYRLEGLGIHLFERVDGEHSAILGLPLLSLLGFLRQHGVIGD